MPYVESLGVQVYYQVEGNGPAVVCEHGFTSSLDSFYEAGYVQGLQETHRLLLMDARGHGKSGKPHDTEAYLADKRVGDVLAVMDAEGISRACYFGYSMGGTTGFAIARSHPERLLGVIIGGMHARSRRPDREAVEERSRGFRELGMERLLEERERQSGPMPPERRKRFLALDNIALAAASDALGQWDGIEEALPGMATPALIFAGRNDMEFCEAAEDAAAAMPNARFVALADQDHSSAFERSDLVLPHIKEFLGSVS